MTECLSGIGSTRGGLLGDRLSHVVEGRGHPMVRLDIGACTRRTPHKTNNAHHVRIGQSLFSLWPNAKRIVSDPKAPKRPRWWDCLKDMTKRTGER
jgi:hypothetical protein